MKYWPGGSYLVMKINSRVSSGKILMDIGYKYNSRKLLGSISDEGSGSNEPDDIHLSRFPDMYSNVSVHLIFHTHFLVRCFNAFN